MDNNKWMTYDGRIDFTENDLKKAINNFLWTYLPGSMTLLEAEKIACLFFETMKKTIEEEENKR